jgi:hypothetical protein
VAHAGQDRRALIGAAADAHASTLQRQPRGNTVPRHSNRDAKKARGEARHGKTRPRRTRSEPPVHRIKPAYATVSSFLDWNSLLVPASQALLPMR